MQRGDGQRLVRRGQQQRRDVGVRQGDPAVAAGDRPGPGPHHLAAGAELVELGGGVVGDAGGQHEAFQRGRRHGYPLQLLDGGGDRLDAAGRRADLLPAGQERGERAGRHRLDLPAQRGERAAAQQPQHLGVAPLGADAVGGELAGDHPPGGGEPAQRLLDDEHSEPEPGGAGGRRERAVGAGVAGHEVAERVGHRCEVGLGDADGQRHAERVAQPGGVLDDHPAVLAGDPHPQHPPGRLQLAQPPGRCAPLGQLGVAQVADHPEQLDHVLRVAGAALLGAPAQLPFGLGQHRGVEQFPQVDPAEQFAEEPGVEGQGGGPPLGQRRVALVEERADVAEEQRAGERRRALGLHLDQADLAGAEVAHQLGQRGLVEDVLEALPGGLQGDREVGVLAGHVEELGGALALLPERLPAARIAAGQQQGPGRALAEPGGEQRRGAHGLLDQLGDLLGVEDHHVGAGRLLGRVGQPDHDAVVGGHDLGVHPVALGEPAADGERPRAVDPGAEHRVHGEPPVAQLVAEPLDHHRAVVGQRPGGLLLLAQVAHEVAGGPVVQPAGPQRGHGVGVGLAQQRPDPGADGPAQLDRATELVALPERHPGGLAGGGGDQHPVGGDLLDPPGRRAEQEDVADPGLVDHLLVQLADPGGPLGAGQEDPEQAPVGDGAAAGHGEPLRAGPAGEHVGRPVPHQSGPQLGEGGRRVAPGEHVEHRVQRRVGQLGEGSRAADQHGEVAEPPRLQGHHRHDLLGQHVQWVARVVQLLDGARAHPLGDHGAGEQVAAVLREDHAPGDRADLVPGPADPLQAGGDARRGLDLHDQVDRAHVDAQLQAGGGDHGRELPGLERLLDVLALLAGDAAVVGPGDHRRRAGRRSREHGGTQAGARREAPGAAATQAGTPG
ncbi:hypothetical protein B0E53_00297 [Micromonospora sp. MH33]|nr:hypothetical protein B0E53_00297 [Micromonospora sp. MH33]